MRIVNNYTKISFNFGPTLLSWVAEHAPEMYQGILECRQAKPEEFFGAWLRDRAGLQPHDHAAGE